MLWCYICSRCYIIFGCWGVQSSYASDSLKLSIALKSCCCAVIFCSQLCAFVSDPMFLDSQLLDKIILVNFSPQQQAFLECLTGHSAQRLLQEDALCSVTFLLEDTQLQLYTSLLPFRGSHFSRIMIPGYKSLKRGTKSAGKGSKKTVCGFLSPLYFLPSQTGHFLLTEGQAVTQSLCPLPPPPTILTMFFSGIFFTSLL